MFTPIINKNVKSYLEQMGTRKHPVLEELRAHTSKMPEAKMQIAPELGQILAFMANVIGAKHILEIGTYTGYSSICFAVNTTAHITTCDHNVEWTKIAKNFWKQANVESRISLILGNALDTLEHLHSQRKKYDFIFIDANKKNYPEYFEYALKLLNKNGLIAIDNTLWDGAVADGNANDSATQILRQLNKEIHQNSKLDFMLLPVDDGITFVRFRD
jgi:O-methyltransferase